MPRPEVIDHTGQRFGYLVALGRGPSTPKYATWRCKCDCGREVIVEGRKLRTGAKKACCIGGHRFKPDYSNRPSGVGLTVRHPREYQSFSSMRERCLNPNKEGYAAYGGRGITVCERWASFENFFADMGPKPTPRHTIERVDNNGNYTPENCKWATPEEQRRNMRTSVYVNYEGKQILLLDLVQKLGLNRNQVYQRLTLGWPLEDALTVPIRAKKKNRKKKYKTP